jgi:hypothetical protein
MCHLQYCIAIGHLHMVLIYYRHFGVLWYRHFQQLTVVKFLIEVRARE